MSESTATQNGRNAHGQFTKGNTHGKGNPFGRRAAEVRSLIVRLFTDENVTKVVHAILEKANAGDLAAAKLLFSYTLGRPNPCIEPNRVNLDEWDIFQREADMSLQLSTTANKPGPDVPLTTTRMARDLLSRQHLTTFLANGEQNDNDHYDASRTGSRSKKRKAKRNDGSRRVVHATAKNRHSAPSPNGVGGVAKNGRLGQSATHGKLTETSKSDKE